ncbi:unnamed protein product [Absidia cylindrospora]
MQRSVLQTLCGSSRLGLTRRTPMTSPQQTLEQQEQITGARCQSFGSCETNLRDSVVSPPSNNTRIRSTLSSPSSTKGKLSSISQVSSSTAAADKSQAHPERKQLDSVLQSFDRSLYFLVEVDPTSRPPVCRLLEKKHLFDKHKASKKNKTVSSDQVTKEIVFGWNVSPHDMGHKLGKAVQFLDKGNKVKVDVVYKRGQKRVDKETQQQVIAQVKQQLDIYKLAKPPTFSGSNCSMVFEQKKSG